MASFSSKHISVGLFPLLLQLLVTILLLVGTQSAIHGDNPALTIKRSVRGERGGQNIATEPKPYPYDQSQTRLLERGDNETKPRNIQKGGNKHKEKGGKSFTTEQVHSGGTASETTNNNPAEGSKSGNDTEPETIESAPHHTKKDKDATPLSVKEKDPLVKEKDLEKEPSLIGSEKFQGLTALGILAASFVIHYWRMKRSKTKTSGGNAYKQIPMDGGEAEMTQLGSSSMDEDDLDAEYGEEPDVDI